MATSTMAWQEGEGESMPKRNSKRSSQNKRSGRSGRGNRSSQTRQEAAARLPAVERRTIKRDKTRTQLLERGEGPTAEAQIDPAVDSPGEQSTDAPSYGDWARHSSGTTSGARGQEGFAGTDEGDW